MIVLKLLFQIFFRQISPPHLNRSVCNRLEHRNVKWWSRQNSRLCLEMQATLVCFNNYFVSPASRQGDEKLVYRLIQLFSSTEIFSKRRKICSWWRKTRDNMDWKPRVTMLNVTRRALWADYKYYLHETHAQWTNSETKTKSACIKW